MTVSSSTNKIIGSGNGVTTSWPFAFKIYDPGHLVVTYTDVGGDETTLDPGNYIVSLNADQDASPGGTVSYSPAIASGTKLTLLRSVPFTQAIDIKNQGGFFPEVLERGFDLVVMQVQQLREQLARTLKLSPSQSAIGELETVDAARAGTYLGFDLAGNLSIYTGLATQAVSSAMQPVVSAASLALARTAMDVPGLGANTFTGAQTLPGDASNALQAVPKQQAESIASAAALASAPVGACFDWPTDTPPANCLERNGAAISRTSYAGLFAVLVTQPGFVEANFTVTIASPGLVTDSGHGYSGGERLRLSTTGALPTGLNATDDFFVIVSNANSYWLATSEANAAAGTKINTSGGQSGTHSRLRSLYGLGDGSTTFKLPDDRGLFTRGKPANGRAIGSYEPDDNKAHAHEIPYVIGILAGGAGGHSASSEVELMTVLMLYHVDRFGAFTGETTCARRSPADEDQVWLIPESTTTEAPPAAGEGEVAVLRRGAWSGMPDHRGRIAYDKALGAGRVIEEPRPPATNETLDVPPSAFHVWEADRWALPLADAKKVILAEVGAELIRRNAADFSHNGVRYQIDDASHARITMLAVLAQTNDGADWPKGFAFIAADNTAVPFDPAAFVEFAASATKAAIARRLNVRALKDTILAAGDANALAAIDLTAGWD